MDDNHKYTILINRCLSLDEMKEVHEVLTGNRRNPGTPGDGQTAPAGPDRAWRDQTPAGKIIMHFTEQCRKAVEDNNDTEAKRCARIAGAIDDVVGEYQDRRNL